MPRCPLLRKCASKIEFKKYNEVCTNITKDAYLDCDEFKKIVAGLKTPAEWESLTSLI